MVALNAVLNVSLIWWLREAGLALATATSATAQTALLLLCAARLPGGRPLDASVRRGAGKTLGVAAAMGAAVGAVLLVLPGATSPLGRMGVLAACVGIGAMVYLAAARLSGAPELRWLLHRGVAVPPKQPRSPKAPAEPAPGCEENAHDP